MKYNLLLIGAMLCSATMLAQNLDPTKYRKSENKPRKSNDARIPGTASINNHNTRAGGDLIWSEDFNGASSFTDWTKQVITGPGAGFVWSEPISEGGTGGPIGPYSDPTDELIESTTADNGFIIIRSDQANDDGAGGSNGNVIEAFCSDTVNLSGQDGIYVTLEHYFRYFVPSAVLQANDPYGLYLLAISPTNDTISVYNLISSISINIGSPNPMTGEKYFIPTTGLPYVKLAFYHLNISNYHWQIDDIEVREAYDNDLTIENVYLNGYGLEDIEDLPSLTGPVYENKFYDQMPQRHAANVTFDMAMVYRNSGLNTPLSVDGDFDVSGPGGVSFSNTTASTAPPASTDLDSIVASSAFSGSSTSLGGYTAEFIVSSTSENDATDNSREIEFDATANMYKWDAFPASRIRRLQTDDMLAVAYEAYDDDTMIAFELGIFDPAEPSPQSIGTVMSVFLYKYSDIIDNFDSRINDGVPAGNSVTPIATLLDFKEITENEVGANLNDYQRFLLSEQIALEAGETYVIGVKNINGDALWIAFDEGVDPAPWSVFENNDASIDGAGGTWFTEQIVPMIRMVTKDASLCLGVNPQPNGTVVDNLDDYTVDIDISSVSGGVGPYLFSWTAPASVDPEDHLDSESGSLEGLGGATATQYIGQYTVKIIDANGCVGQPFTYDVQGNIGIDELSSSDFSIYPNPASSSINLAFNNEGRYNVEIRNMSGQIVLSQVYKANSGNVETVSTGEMARGIYLVKVSDETSVSVRQVILE